MLESGGYKFGRLRYHSTAPLYECNEHYFLFFHTSSTCDQKSTVNIGGVLLMQTRGCAELQMTAGNNP